MTGKDDLLYYDRRARQERQHAGTCQNNAIAQIHLTMAAAYERRIDDASARTQFKLVSVG